MVLFLIGALDHATTNYDSMLAEITAGLVLGLSAGITPGPLSVLVLTQSLRHGAVEGIKVAIAPILTDLPIVALCLVLAGSVAQVGGVLAALSVLGAIYLIYLAYESMKARPLELEGSEFEPRSLRRGALVNVLNPHPYLFWLTVGAPIVVRGFGQGGVARASAFIAPFYLMLVGSKVVMALLAGTTGRALPPRAYVFVVRGLGVLLLVFAAALLREGIVLLRN